MYMHRTEGLASAQRLHSYGLLMLYFGWTKAQPECARTRLRER